MQTPSITRSTLMHADVRKWAWWQLPGVLRLYVGAMPVAAIIILGFAASRTAWNLDDLLKFLLLLTCGLVSVAATPRIAYLQGGTVKDFITAWVLPVAVLLPPVYAQ